MGVLRGNGVPLEWNLASQPGPVEPPDQAVWLHPGCAGRSFRAGFCGPARRVQIPVFQRYPGRRTGCETGFHTVSSGNGGPDRRPSKRNDKRREDMIP
jgi:hypothetical protein